MLAAIADTNALLKVVAASFIAGIGISIAFSLVILGVSRSGEQRSRGHAVAAGAYLAVAVLAFGAFGAGLVYGISVMASK